MHALNMHQEYFQDAKPYDCSLSQLPSPNEGLVFKAMYLLKQIPMIFLPQYQNLSTLVGFTSS